MISAAARSMATTDPSAVWAAADPCSWPIDPTQCCDVTDADPDVVAEMVEVASVMLSRLSGYTVGECPATVRPLDICPKCRGWCCGGADGIALHGPNRQPVSSVTAVHVGAETLLPEEYRWDAELGILWKVPPGGWPTSDARWAECGEPGAFCVDVVAGTAPDAWALSVGATLTCELVKSCTGEKCRLPTNTTTVTQQGVTVVLGEDDIVSMLPEVRAWTAAVNPFNARLPAAIYSPELSPSHSTGPRSSLPFSGGCCG